MHRDFVENFVFFLELVLQKNPSNTNTDRVWFGFVLFCFPWDILVNDLLYLERKTFKLKVNWTYILLASVCYMSLPLHF